MSRNELSRQPSEPIWIGPLRQDVRALRVAQGADRVEVRSVDDAGVGGSDVREHRTEVRVAAADLLDVGDRAAERLEVVAEGHSQSVGVGALVVDRRGRVDAQLREDEVGHDRTLDLVVVRRAQVEGLVRLLRRQARVRVRGRDQDHALVTQDRVGDAERGARARGPDHGDDVRVGSERGRTGLPTFRRTPVVLLRELDVVPQELSRRRVERVVQVVDRERDTVVAVRPEERGVPGDREQRRQLDRIAGGDLHAPELIGCTVDRSARGGRAPCASGLSTPVVAAGSGDERQRPEERQDREILTVLHPTPFRRCPTIVVVRERV